MRVHLMAVVAMAAVAWPVSWAEAGPLEEGFVRARSVAIIAAAKDLDATEARAAFEREMDVAIDFDRVAIFALGRYARSLPEAKRVPYVRAYRAVLVNLLEDNISGFGRGRVEVVGSTDRKPGDSIVRTRIVPERGESIEIYWRVVAGPQGYRLVDVQVGGIWLAIQQRDEMLALLDRLDGDFDALIANLSARAAGRAAAT